MAAASAFPGFPVWTMLKLAVKKGRWIAFSIVWFAICVTAAVLSVHWDEYVWTTPSSFFYFLGWLAAAGAAAAFGAYLLVLTLDVLGLALRQVRAWNRNPYAEWDEGDFAEEGRGVNFGRWDDPAKVNMSATRLAHHANRAIENASTVETYAQILGVVAAAIVGTSFSLLFSQGFPPPVWTMVLLVVSFFATCASAMSLTVFVPLWKRRAKGYRIYEAYLREEPDRPTLPWVFQTPRNTTTMSKLEIEDNF
jgi:hypothetical protein